MEPVRRRKLSEDILDRLIDAISSHRFPPGSKLPSERELMAMMGVGRPAIREAMQSLHQMGLIIISHGERARVVNPTPDVIIEQISSAMVTMLATNARGLEDLKEARLLLESALVRMATRKATAQDLQRLQASLRTLHEARGDHQAFVGADMAFHGIIAEMSGNSMIAAVCKGVLDWLSRFKRDLVSVPGAERVTIQEHERIYKSIAGGDAEGAATQMTEHITRANNLYLQLRTSSDTHEEPPVSTQLV